MLGQCEQPTAIAYSLLRDTRCGFSFLSSQYLIDSKPLLCVQIWPTSERRQFASFTGALYQDEFFLIVKKTNPDTGFWASIRKPFDPFTLQLWVVIILTFALVGGILAWENANMDTSNWWDFTFKILPIGIIKGVNGIHMGEIPETERRTSGSWITQSSLSASLSRSLSQATPLWSQPSSYLLTPLRCALSKRQLTKASASV